MAVALLERNLYSISEAAWLLGLPPQTLRRWLQGWKTRGKPYEPVIRESINDREEVTWGEFVEAGFLREYRLSGVPVQNMRPFIQRVRDEFDIAYPFAHFKPLVGSRELVYGLQLEAGLDQRLFVVTQAGDQTFLNAEPLDKFLKKVEFSPEQVVQRWLPLGNESPVALDPDLSYGIPQIRGIRTELIVESVEAGGYEEASASWGVTRGEIDAAVEWDASLHQAA
jgi:hypothetical protein